MGYFTELFIQIIAIVILIIVPIVLVLVSSRVEATGKILWSIAMFFFSWLAYIIFILTTKKPEQAAD